MVHNVSSCVCCHVMGHGLLSKNDPVFNFVPDQDGLLVVVIVYLRAPAMLLPLTPNKHHYRPRSASSRPQLTQCQAIWSHVPRALKTNMVQQSGVMFQQQQKKPYQLVKIVYFPGHES